MNRHPVLVALVAAVLAMTLAGPAPAEAPPAKAEAARPAEANLAAQAAAAAVEEAATARRAETDILIPLPPPEPAMPDVVLTRAEVEAGTTEGVVEGQMRLAITSRTDETRCVLTLPPPIVVTGVSVKRGKSDNIQIVRREDGYYLYTLGKGDYELSVSFASTVQGEELRKQAALPLPAATTAVMRLVLPGTSLDVTVAPALPSKVEEGKDTTTLTVYGGPGGVATVTWTLKAPEKVLEPKVFAEQNATVHLGLGVLRLVSEIGYSIVQGKPSTFRVALPADATLLKVEGPDIRAWEVEGEGAARTLRVDLLAPVTNQYRFSLALEQAIGTPQADQPVTLQIPLPTALDVSRETGWVAITTDKGLKAEAERTEGVSQMDVRDMPQTLLAAGGDVQLGFKYVKRPVVIAARLSLVEAKVSGDVYRTVKITPESLRILTTIQYQIKDAGVFRFRIRLDPGVRLADLEGQDINNWSLANEILSVDLRSKAEKEYTLRLVTEKQIAGQEVEIPRLELLDVQRERGYVAMEVSPGTKVDPKAAEGIAQINVKDLPVPMMDPAPASLAYRYIRHPYRLAVVISEVQPEIIATTQSLIDVEETEIRVSFDATYDIRKAGVFALRLQLPKDLQILSLEGKGVDDWKLDKQTGIVDVSLEAKTQDIYALRLTAEQRLEKGAAGPMPLPNITCLDVRRETGFLAVRPSEGMRVRSAEEGVQNLREIDVKELPQPLQQAGVALAYKYFLQPWQASLHLESIEPYVTAEIFNFISLGEAYLQAAATIQYVVQYAGQQTFRFQLPADAVNVDITAADLKNKAEDPDQPNRWTLTFQAKHKGSLFVNVSYQTNLDKEAKALAFKGVEVLDVKHERGFVAVAPRSDLEVYAAEQTTGLIPIDDLEIPASYRQGIPAAVALAYRYPARPYELVLSMVRRESAEVLVALIESCRLNTTVTEDGNLVTDVVYRMRNTRKQYLELVLPKDAKIWHAFVDRDRVTPMTSERDGKPITMIPVIGRGKDQRPFEVRLRYSSNIGEALGRTGRLALDVPESEIATMRVGWELALPEDYVVVNDWGSLTRVPALDAQLAAMSPLPSGAQQRINPAMAAEMSPQDRMQTEFNLRVWEHADTGVQPAASATEQPAQPDRPTQYAPDRPITMNRYYFQTLIAIDKSPTLRVRYMTVPVNAVSRGVVAVLALLGCVLAWRKLRASAGWRFLGNLSAAALVLAIRTLARHSYEQYLTDILWILAASAVVFGGYHLMHWFGRRVSAWLQGMRSRRPVLATASVRPSAPPQRSEDEFQA